MWVEISIDCYIQMFQLKPHPHHGSHFLVVLPLHIATIISISTIGMWIVITVRESSKSPLLHLSLSDPVTSGGFATAFLTVYHTSRKYLLMRLTSLLGIFHAIPPLMFPNSFPIIHLVLNRDLARRISSPK